MSKTDKTAPLWVVEKRGECSRLGRCGAGYPCKHISMSKNLTVLKQEFWGRERTRIRTAIQRGEEDILTDQHRHCALWDLV